MSEHTDFGEGLAGIRDDVCLSDSMNSTAVDALALRNKTDFDLVLFALGYLYNGGRITARQGNLIGGEINRRLDISVAEMEVASRLVLLRGTIGNAQWLDNLDDEQWRVLVHEIMPPFYQEEWRRGETSTRLDKKLKFLGALNNALEVTRNPDVTPADIEQALNSVLEHYKDDEALNKMFRGETSED